MKAKLFVLAAILLSGCLVFGQGSYKGSVTAEVTTEDGSPLPGAVAELTADTFSRSFVSDANGMVRFVGLNPARYELRVTFTGFNTYVRPNIIVDTGQNVRLTVVMTPSTQQEEMVVTLESPLLDSTKVGTATVMTEDELNAVPQSRDPWSVIMTVPGVQTDRINVGGSEAGQQSNFASKGDDGSNASWVMDGIEFVDPAARGATQSYLDFSSFQQMNVTTGGADVSQRSGGAALSFVTKQGSNNHQGSVRLLYADQDFHAGHIYEEDGGTFSRNRIAETFEKSFEIGGPIIKDRLWYWGAFSQNSITQLTVTDQEDRTELRNISFKIHGDITATTRFNAFYTEGDKIKNGRGAGANRPVNTTWDQSGPSPIYKFELNQLIGQHTELSLLAARVDGGFGLAPRGTTGQIGIDLSTGIWDNTTFIDYSTRRPVRQYEIKGNTFLSSSSIDHELSYGFQYKEATVNSKTTYGPPGQGMIRYYAGADAFGVSLYREGNATTDAEYVSATVQDTMTMGNWTFKAGLRWDRQEGNNTGSSVGGSSIRPDILPDVNYGGGTVPFTWSTIAPRLGVTYTMGDDNQYLFRGSVSQFYDTMGTGSIAGTNPTFVKYSYHYWYDDGDLVVETGELSDSIVNNTSRPLDLIDGDLDPPQTNELILGFEWAISPEFTMGLTGTFRERKDELFSSFNLNSPLNPSTDYDKVAATTTDPITGNEVDVSYFVMNENGAAKLNDVNSLLTNRPGYSEDYTGFELTATKRLSNRWMLRANITLQDWTRNVGAEGIQDPNDFRSGANEDGGSVGIQSAGSGNRSNVWYGSSSWTFNVNGLYQLPWDLTISANINGREGFTQPYGERHSYFDAAGLRNVVFVKYDSFDANRGDDIMVADLKLTKTFHLSGRTKVELAAEVFNAFDEDVVLARELRTGISRTGQPVEILAPRVGRFSATVHF